MAPSPDEDSRRNDPTGEDAASEAAREGAAPDREPGVRDLVPTPGPKNSFDDEPRAAISPHRHARTGTGTKVLIGVLLAVGIPLALLALWLVFVLGTCFLGHR